MDAIDEAILARAKLLILQFVKPTHVCKELGLSRAVLDKHLKTWEKERDAVAFGIDYSAEKARQKFTAHQTMVLAIDEVLEVIKNKRALKNSKGKKVYMDMFETDAMMNVLMKLDRLIPMTPHESESPREVAKDPSVIDATYQVITNQKVLQAIKKDKSMYSMLKEAINGEGDSRNDRHNDGEKQGEGLSDVSKMQSHIRHAENVEGSGDALLRLVEPKLSGSQELRDGESAKISNEIDISALSEGEANRVLGQRIDDGYKDRGTSEQRDPGASEQRHAGSSNKSSEGSSDVKRVASPANTHTKSSDQSDAAATREDGSREQYSEVTDEARLDDVFEDEFS